VISPHFDALAESHAILTLSLSIPSLYMQSNLSRSSAAGNNNLMHRKKEMFVN